MTSLKDKRTSLGIQFMGDQKKKELRDLFNSFDIDKDGKISHSEFKQVLIASGVDPQSVMTILHENNKKNDRGNNVFYSYEEFVRLFKPTLSTPGRRTAKEQELMDAFNTFDHNKDGVITHQELRLTLQQLGEYVSEQEAKDIIADVDENKDGVVNFPEFLHMMGMRKRTSSSSSFNFSSPFDKNKKPVKEKKLKFQIRDKLKRIFH
ncbi:hypothetical protein INT45_004430 [Circinella minor]|uniref:EF-hand domain-containing protein n=1 Tax=Circinella minor TaxID=1195481 RepID=A0A8H7VFI5_9FUNG|nr:hypothetical protein INT45_004430 [Circinella minor]